MRALVVDDEQPARDRLIALLHELEAVEVVGEAANATVALLQYGALHPDLLYLDVRMPGMSGLELARHLSLLDSPPAVIFTTAHDEHAMEAFDAQAIGYLLKPVRKEKLAAATERAGRLTRQQVAGLAQPAPRSHLAVRQRDELRLLQLEEVICLVAEQKYTTIRHTGGEDLIEDSLRTLEQEFGSRFVRIHRNALVNAQRIEALERSADGHYRVRLRGLAESLPVSRRAAAELKERIAPGG
jgi:two-component system, LytTR family, response regulator AlgR